MSDLPAVRDFEVWVLAADGSAHTVRQRAPSWQAATEAVRQAGHRPLAVEARWPARSALTAVSPAPRRRAVHDSLFAQQLQEMVRAGIGPVEGLRALAGHATGAYATTLRSIQHGLETGCSLASSVEQAGGFDALLVALLGAAERTSDLDGALKRFLLHRERMDALRQRVITTAVYPALLIVVGVAVLLFLLLHVVPRFSGIFSNLHADLPWAAELMLRWGLLVRAHTGWVVGLLLVMACCLAVLVASPPARAWVLTRVSRRGWLAAQIRLINLCRYYRTIASLLGGGIALPQSMAMANVLMPEHLRPAASAALQRVAEGLPASIALMRNGLSTPIAEQLLQVGERSGQLGSMLERAADFHDEEVGRNIERFMRALEPIVMTAVGVAIGVVVILMYLPIFELASAVR